MLLRVGFSRYYAQYSKEKILMYYGALLVLKEKIKKL